jgi:hypothetical protein
MEAETNPTICEACGSDHIIIGPFYSQKDFVCMECGHRREEPEINFVPTESERAQQEMENAQELASQELTMEIMSDPAKMEEYLKNLQKAAGTVGTAPSPEGATKKRRSKKPAPPVGEAVVEQAEFGLEPDLIWQAIHIYKRKQATWNQVLADAKGEMEYRNENVLCFAHDHEFGVACTGTCRQV